MGSRGSNESGLTDWSHVWNNLDLPEDEITVYSAPHPTISSWQEEAHWMSFRHAVQQFASHTLVKEAKDKDAIHEDVASSIEQNQDHQKKTHNSTTAHSPTSSISSSLASDLAETKMRLALAQAERDELEFQLLQKEAVA